MRIANPSYWLAAVALLAASAAPAATRFVSPAGSDSGNCTLTPCRTISYAVDQATAGDVVSVASGTYTESVLIQKRLAVMGADATLDAAGHDEGFVISGAGAAGSLLQGFTVENAGLEGVFARQTSRVSIVGNRVLNNDAYGAFSPQCANSPDDCGEALHLQSVTHSLVKGNLVQNNIGGILLTDEDGPTFGNVIAENRVLDNSKDCGITLASHWFQLGSPVTEGVGGVYQNQVLHNLSNGNGAAGIGIFAGPPGAAAWGNVVVGNTATNNGLPGVAIHSHTPFQYVNDNVVVNNKLSNNGADDDAQTGKPAGIVVFSDTAHGASPIRHTTIASNAIRDEYYGIWAAGAVKLSGLPSNDFADSVVVPISIH
ncbi:MAG TPA: right-handed parallel beta-helix repeat-containing protein [Terriglobales bacterium]|nr:right-handed parallel beta-helix repeat-containing protein [Terriglobales bacterium]